MPTFTVGLARTCLVQVDAKSLDDALMVASNFIGSVDQSLDWERNELDFKINDIEIIDNSAFVATQTD
jgi:hypothetical protein